MLHFYLLFKPNAVGDPLCLLIARRTSNSQIFFSETAGAIETKLQMDVLLLTRIKKSLFKLWQHGKTVKLFSSESTCRMPRYTSGRNVLWVTICTIDWLKNMAARRVQERGKMTTNQNVILIKVIVCFQNKEVEMLVILYTIGRSHIDWLKDIALWRH